ncbi:DNA-directed RNA polymerase core subunit rpc40 [Coemansia sp. RSA 2706]|nr:DNA-directed RNA polymerase core subunit rpc40 [Coemansia sp. RSA 2711]KAJ2306580.1 DNA-directed RNA polymerase core subunit rpc40 [Coemansia sp. RSA 2706]KAJ2311506.1 DNA-directed RNA polymerase core subunit rpc40 [Coemansia sp. RSA 2705]KAJ2320960.1 DNA-directed RNA polymerase core subunit rpc40 [Coemansia sp. RSA 2704]KAJ2328306.1 DNA-directed RNA polymerase core subunit rpc40 [Coemansia sp. RSA 2702]KAJ2368401.1 DNA-directed RNA polymerase core subunit rpc40 [Coemansia sp. RSA 2610]KAJ
MSIEDRNRVVILEDRVENVSGAEFPLSFDDQELAHNLESFGNSFDIQIVRVTPTDIEFDLIGVDASIANALRRVLIAEVPTMAIEDVYMLNNTGIVQDEVLAHRLGLIPIKADASEFTWKQKSDGATDQNTLVFKLYAACTANPEAAPGETDPNKKYINGSVYSSQLVWEPAGDQQKRLASVSIGPIHDDILITKLRPGQVINCELHCQKGVGKDHAKFSPVATASYRLLPEIQILEDITGDDADLFRECFPPGVVDVVVEDGVRKAKVVNARKDTVSREVLRHKQFEGKVRLTRVRDHFIFNVESTGIISPEDLVAQALDVLMEKCDIAKSALTKATQAEEEAE